MRVLAEQVVAVMTYPLKAASRKFLSPEGFPINDPTPGPLLPDREESHGRIE